MSLRGINLTKSFGSRTVVRDVSVHVERSEIVGLLGPNGAGKTTTFSMIVGIERPDAGRVTLDDQEITGRQLHMRARLGLGYLPQLSSVFAKLTVRDNLNIYLERLALSAPERRARADAMMEEFGIGTLADSRAYQLSGGERRRLEVCRALLLEPKYLLLDEPFAGIDPVAVEELQKIVRRVQGKGIGVLITDHNVRETLRLVDRAYLIHQGEVFLEGTPAQIATDPAARTIYLGKGFDL